jgi:hypothetical protein
MEELIDELKSKNKYEEWVRHGSYFGLISNCDAKYFLIRPYKYYDMNENIINVSMIQKTFRPDVTNIPVFKVVLEIDPTHVDQDSFRIVEKNETLSTGGLATCTCLAMVIGNKKFMAHIDALTDINPILFALKKLDAPIEKANIYTGELGSTISLQKTITICKEIGTEAMCESVDMFDRVSI